MRTCRHLDAFKIDVSVLDPGLSGLPPWMALCENCSDDVFQALHRWMEITKERGAGGKSHTSQIYGHLTTLLSRLRQIPEERTIIVNGIEHKTSMVSLTYGGVAALAFPDVAPADQRRDLTITVRGGRVAPEGTRAPDFTLTTLGSVEIADGMAFNVYDTSHA